MNYNLEIQRILLQVNKCTKTDDRIRLLKRAVNLADVNNDIDWGLDLRLGIIREEIDLPNYNESFPAFVWILNAYDTIPDLIDEKQFLWEYKWMIDAAICDSNIALEQIDEIIEDYRKRLNRNGYSDYVYYSSHLYKNMFLGEFEKAEEALKLKQAQPRDQMADHPDWEQDARVVLSLKEGNFDDAIFQAQGILHGKSICEGIPFATVSSMSYYLARANDSRCHEYCERANIELSLLQPNPSFICNVAQLVFSNYKIGNMDTAWQYIEQTLHWTLTASDFLKFDYIVFILPLLKEKQTRTLNLNYQLPFYRPDNIYNVEDIYNYYLPIAKELSLAFDKRNKSTVFSRRLETHLTF